MKILLYLLLGVVLIIVAFFAWFFLFFLEVGAINVPESATETERLELIDQYLTKLQKDGKFNGAVLLARNHEPLLMKTYGFTDASLQEELSVTSSFRLASVSKQFTAAGILRAQQLGLLDIDQPVSIYLTSFPYPEVTVRHLLNQTSGFPDNYMKLAEAHRESLNGPITISDVVRLVREAEPVADAKPGESFSYSNTNYVLLAGIIEAVGGRTFEDFLQRELFDPLGMQHTRVWNLVSRDTSFPGKTEGFYRFRRFAEALKPGFLDGVAGDGAVHASISDFLIWDKFWASGNDLVADTLLHQALEPARLNNGKASRYGFGWVVVDDNFQWHNGSWLGAKTYIGRNQDNEALMVILDNSENMRIDDIVQTVKDAWGEL